eukprot:m.1095 g.1095  ORF g.1095 m.1095 type:complete len:372 (-) comp561_c0_seq1:210-1325(-)
MALCVDAEEQQRPRVRELRATIKRQCAVDLPEPPEASERASAPPKPAAKRKPEQLWRELCALSESDDDLMNAYVDGFDVVAEEEEDEDDGPDVERCRSHEYAEIEDCAAAARPCSTSPMVPPARSPRQQSPRPPRPPRPVLSPTRGSPCDRARSPLQPRNGAVSSSVNSATPTGGVTKLRGASPGGRIASPLHTSQLSNTLRSPPSKAASPRSVTSPSSGALSPHGSCGRRQQQRHAEPSTLVIEVPLWVAVLHEPLGGHAPRRQVRIRQGEQAENSSEPGNSLHITLLPSPPTRPPRPPRPETPPTSTGSPRSGATSDRVISPQRPPRPQASPVVMAAGAAGAPRAHGGGGRLLKKLGLRKLRRRASALS